jgi:hypothetical protein
MINWKGFGRANLGYTPGISAQRLGKTIKTLRISGVPAEIRTGHLSNTSQKPVRFGRLVRSDKYKCDKN